MLRSIIIIASIITTVFIRSTNSINFGLVVFDYRNLYFLIIFIKIFNNLTIIVNCY